MGKTAPINVAVASQNLIFSGSGFDFGFATNEVLVMISLLLLDWKISFADESIKSLDDIQHFQGLTVQPRIPALKVSPRV